MMRRGSTYDLGAAGDVLHVPDRHGLVVGEVDLALGGEEAVDLGLRGVLRGEVLLVHGLLGNLVRRLDGVHGKEFVKKLIIK